MHCRLSAGMRAAHAPPPPVNKAWELHSCPLAPAAVLPCKPTCLNTHKLLQRACYCQRPQWDAPSGIPHLPCLMLCGGTSLTRQGMLQLLSQFTGESLSILLRAPLSNTS